MNDIKSIILSLLGRKPSPAKRREIAQGLEALAAEQRRIAEAEQRQLERPPAERIASRAAHAGPGRAPARFVRIETEKRGRARLYVGRGLWYDLGSPKRLVVERQGNRLILTPGHGDEGLAVNVGTGIPRMSADGMVDILPPDGRYDRAEVRGGRIVVEL